MATRCHASLAGVQSAVCPACQARGVTSTVYRQLRKIHEVRPTILRPAGSWRGRRAGGRAGATRVRSVGLTSTDWLGREADGGATLSEYVHAPLTLNA